MTVCASVPSPSYHFSTEGHTRLLTVGLSSLESLNGVDLEIGTNEVRLLLPSDCKPVIIPLPADIGSCVESPTAKFSKKRRELTITWALSVGASVGIGAADTTSTTASVVPATPAAALTAGDGLTRDSQPAIKQTPVGTDERRCPSAEESPVKAKDVEATLECLDELEEEIEHALKQCTIKQLRSLAKLGGCSVFLSDFEVDGEAGMTKKACRFKASVSFKWEVMDPIGGFLGAAGIGRVADLAPEQNAPNVSIKVSTRGSLKARSASEWMEQHGACLISECLRGDSLAAALLTHWDALAAEAAAEAPNEEAMQEWAEEWLVRKLTSLNVTLFGGAASVSFANPQVSLSKADEFALKLECNWVLSTSKAKTEGTLSLPEFSLAENAKIPQVDIDISPGSKVSGQLITAFKQSGVSAVRAAVSQFNKEFILQIKR